MIKEVSPKNVGSSEKKSKKILGQVAYWAILNLGLFLVAFSLWMFLAPNSFAVGGVGGISVVLSEALQSVVGGWVGEYIFSYYGIFTIFNIILLIFGLIFLGKSLTLKTIYCTVMLSAMNIALGFIPMGAVFKGGFGLTGGNHMFLELCFGVLISGLGQAIVFNCRASSGGTDIIALIIKKFSKANIGFALFAVDIIIACVPFFTKWATPEIALYSMLGVFAKSFVIDGVIENITKTKYVTIITVNPDVVSEVIRDYIHRGFTKLDGAGGFTGDPRTVIITVCRRSQAAHLKAKLHEVDPTAFVIITDAKEIVGRGFAEKL
ncbi:MAG: YitT family protein [Clostridiales bacterium]|nr:YitT family protein [Clostridiales bacterium]